MDMSSGSSSDITEKLFIFLYTSYLKNKSLTPTVVGVVGCMFCVFPSLIHPHEGLKHSTAFLRKGVSAHFLPSSGSIWP